MSMFRSLRMATVWGKSLSLRPQGFDEEILMRSVDGGSGWPLN